LVNLDLLLFAEATTGVASFFQIPFLSDRSNKNESNQHNVPQPQDKPSASAIFFCYSLLYNI